MRNHCPRAVDCRAQGDSGYYCPCRVRHLLAEYAELLQQRLVLLDARHGEQQRVQNKRPAYVVIEDQLAQRADIACALIWLCEEFPMFGHATALAYGFHVAGRQIIALAERDEHAPAIPPPTITTIAALLTATRRAELLRRTARQAVCAPIRRDTVRELIHDGVQAMAYHLGWRPGYDEEEQTA